LFLGLDQLNNTLSQEITRIAVLLEKGVEKAVNLSHTTCLQWGLPVS